MLLLREAYYIAVSRFKSVFLPFYVHIYTHVLDPECCQNTGDLHSVLCLIASCVDTGAAAAMLITCCSNFASCVGVMSVTSAGMPGWRNDWPLSGIVTEVWNFTQSADIVEEWREEGFERPCKCMRHIRMTSVFDWTCQKIVYTTLSPIQQHLRGWKGSESRPCLTCEKLSLLNGVSQSINPICRWNDLRFYVKISIHIIMSGLCYHFEIPQVGLHHLF